MDAYKPDENNGVLFATLNHPEGHANLPPAFFQIDGLDPLRDEGLIYERVLRKEYNIVTKLNVYPGVPHGHWISFPFLKSSEQFRRDQVAGMGFLLGKKPDLSNITFDAVPVGL